MGSCQLGNILDKEDLCSRTCDPRDYLPIVGNHFYVINMMMYYLYRPADFLNVDRSNRPTNICSHYYNAFQKKKDEIGKMQYLCSGDKCCYIFRPMIIDTLKTKYYRFSITYIIGSA